jgi:hypothetical protein
MSTQSAASDSKPKIDPAELEAIAATIDWQGLEAVMHRDPGGRGLASFRRDGRPLDAGSLRAASCELAGRAGRVLILTGFCIRLEDRLTAETDGPPGALFLAQVLLELGVDVMLVTDACALPFVQAGAALLGFAPEVVSEFPQVEYQAWIDRVLDAAEPRGRWTHWIAIERPGPSHTVESFQSQRRPVPIPLETFQTAVPELDRNACHNMRGEIIDAHTAPTHRLFERASELNLPVKTIGIGDGGNELGMGAFLWEDLVEAIATGPAGKIACRVAADFPLLAGTSNWGGYALGIATAKLRGQPLASRWFTPEGQLELIEHLVAAGAVDGRSRRAEATVDGLTIDDYLRPLSEMLAIVRGGAR